MFLITADGEVVESLCVTVWMVRYSVKSESICEQELTLPVYRHSGVLGV